MFSYDLLKQLYNFKNFFKIKITENKKVLDYESAGRYF